jgi:hypothetical protein
MSRICKKTFYLKYIIVLIQKYIKNLNKEFADSTKNYHKIIGVGFLNLPGSRRKREREKERKGEKKKKPIPNSLDCSICGRHCIFIILRHFQ